MTDTNVMAIVQVRAKQGADLVCDFLCRDPRPGYLTQILSAALQIRTSYDAVTALASYTTADDELEANGETVLLRVPYATTETWPVGTYVFDLEIDTAQGRFRPFEGSVTVSPQVTV